MKKIVKTTPLVHVELSAVSGGQILIGYGSGDALALPDATTIERFEFADGSTYSLAELIAQRGDDVGRSAPQRAISLWRTMQAMKFH